MMVLKHAAEAEKKLMAEKGLKTQEELEAWYGSREEGIAKIGECLLRFLHREMKRRSK